MEHKLHMKLYIKTAKGYPGELNVFGDSGKELAQAIAGVFEAMNLEPQGVGLPVLHTATPVDSPDREAEIEAKATAFLAECETHKTRWYDNESTRGSGGTYKSHKIEQGVFCQYKNVAKTAWADLMAQLSWSETEAKEFLGGKPFSSLSEKDQALAIARLRVGR